MVFAKWMYAWKIPSKPSALNSLQLLKVGETFSAEAEFIVSSKLLTGGWGITVFSFFFEDPFTVPSYVFSLAVIQCLLCRARPS